MESYRVLVTIGLLTLSCRAEPPITQTATQHGDQYTYLDNGVIRVGLDLTRGGSIGFLGPTGSQSNVINCHDMGREVQLSFYAGPDFYNPNGKCNKLFMSQVTDSTRASSTFM